MTRFAINSSRAIHSVNEALWAKLNQPGIGGASQADLMGLRLVANDSAEARAMRRAMNYPLTRATSDALGEGWDDA